MSRVLRYRSGLIVAALLTAAANLTAEAAESSALPQVRVASVRRVFHNGEHNAFTDLVRFLDTFYLTFRSCPDDARSASPSRRGAKAKKSNR